MAGSLSNKQSRVDNSPDLRVEQSGTSQEETSKRVLPRLRPAQRLADRQRCPSLMVAVQQQPGAPRPRAAPPKLRPNLSFHKPAKFVQRQTAPQVIYSLTFLERPVPHQEHF